jgi:hypothetical protein
LPLFSVISAVTIDRDTGAFLLLAASALVATIAAMIRYGLLPYLRDQLIRPMQESNRELTGGKDAPSLRDELHQLRRIADDHSGEIEDATLELRAMALMFDGHLEWSQAEVDRLWAELKRQRAAGERPPKPRHRGGDHEDR